MAIYFLAIVANLVLSAFMVGVIWFVQIIQYPLLAKIGAESFIDYHREYTKRAGYLLGPVMVFEMGIAVLLCFLSWNSSTFFWWLLNIGLVLAIWFVTFRVSVPDHEKLAQGASAGVIRHLVVTNWWRTFFWTLKMLIAIVLVTHPILEFLSF